MKNGFTLVELSIVLVIIGLAAASILIGRDLIATAALRAQISQIQKYNTAMNAFHAKYGFLPGDVTPTAAQEYGFATRGPNPGQGDGNGLIEGMFSDAGDAYNIKGNGMFIYGGESPMVWVDLSKAGMLDGSFTTANLTTPPPAVTALEVPLYFPAAKIGNGNYVYAWSGGWRAVRRGGDGYNYLSVSALVGSPASFQGLMASNVNLSVFEAYSMDSKIDDGMPQAGKVTALSAAIRYWACGGNWNSLYPPSDPAYGANNIGDVDGTTGGPITGDTITPYYATDNGAEYSDTCYNNGHTLQPEHYSTEFNNGQGRNCAVSFQIQ